MAKRASGSDQISMLSEEQVAAMSEEQIAALAEELAQAIQAESHKKSRKKWIAIYVLLLLLFAALVAGFLYLTSSSPEDEELKPDPNVQIGSLTGGTENLDKIVDEGMLTFGINATPSFETGSSAGNLMIENDEINNNRFTVTIYRDDTKEVVYESGYLDPGQYIENAKLDTALPAGTYSCTAQFNTYSLENNKPIGTAAAQITIYVTA